MFHQHCAGRFYQLYARLFRCITQTTYWPLRPALVVCTLSTFAVALMARYLIAQHDAVAATTNSELSLADAHFTDDADQRPEDIDAFAAFLMVSVWCSNRSVVLPTHVCSSVVCSGCQISTTRLPFSRKLTRSRARPQFSAPSMLRLPELFCRLESFKNGREYFLTAKQTLAFASLGRVQAITNYNAAADWDLDALGSEVCWRDSEWCQASTRKNYWQPLTVHMCFFFAQVPFISASLVDMQRLRQIKTSVPFIDTELQVVIVFMLLLMLSILMLPIMLFVLFLVFLPLFACLFKL